LHLHLSNSYIVQHGASDSNINYKFFDLHLRTTEKIDFPRQNYDNIKNCHF